MCQAGCVFNHAGAEGAYSHSAKSTQVICYYVSLIALRAANFGGMWKLK